LLTFFPLFVFCQNSVEQKTKAEKIIKFDIGSLLGDMATNSTGIQLGIESELKDSYSFEQDLMYIFKFDRNNYQFPKIDIENIYGLKSSSELRYYLRKGIKPILTDVYWGHNLILQYTYAKRKQFDNQDKDYYFVNRFVFAFHEKIGLQFSLYKNIYFDISFGIGIRYISSNTVNDEFNNNNNESEYPYVKPYNSGSKWFPSITGGYKIGFKLK